MKPGPRDRITGLRHPKRTPMDSLTAAQPLLALWATGAAILVLLVLSALFSGSETALTTASRGKLHGMAERGDPGAAAALALTEDKERLIGAILLGNTAVNILAASLATALFTRLFGARRRRDRDGGDDGAGADLLGGDAQDLRDHQSRADGGPGRRGHRRAGQRPGAGGERGAGDRAAGAAALRGRDRPEGAFPRRPGGDRRRDRAAPFRGRWSRRPTATGCSARSTSASARSRR